MWSKLNYKTEDASGGDFDWLLVLTHVVTLGNSEDVSPRVCRNSLPAGANHLTY